MGNKESSIYGIIREGSFKSSAQVTRLLAEELGTVEALINLKMPEHALVEMELHFRSLIFHNEWESRLFETYARIKITDEIRSGYPYEKEATRFVPIEEIVRDKIHRKTVLEFSEY